MVTTASVTITGRYTRGDRTPATGTVTIRPNVVPPIIRDTANRVILAGAVVARLDGAGAFTVEVPATDDPNLDPHGFTYTATVDLDHLARTEEVPAVHFAAPAAAVELDLATVSHHLRASPVYAQPATGAEVATITRLAGDAARLAGDAARVVEDVAQTIDGVAAELPELRQTIEATAEEVNGRLSEVALSASIVSATYDNRASRSSRSRVVGWGDSISDNTWEPHLEALLGGVTVFERGYSGEESSQIAFRQGGVTYASTSAVTIPASPIAVDVPVSASSIPHRVAGRNFRTPAPAVFAGVSGFVTTLDSNETPFGAADAAAGTGTVRFVRATAGSSVAAPAGSLMRGTEGDDHRNDTAIFFAGQNDAAFAGELAAKIVLANTEAMIQHLAPDVPDFIVLGPTTGSGLDVRPVLLQIAAGEREAFPSQFRDVRRHIIDNGLRILGITPTAGDTAAIAADTIPPSLLTDGVHPTSACHERVIAPFIRDQLVTKRPSAAPAPEWQPLTLLNGSATGTLKVSSRNGVAYLRGHVEDGDLSEGSTLAILDGPFRPAEQIEIPCVWRGPAWKWYAMNLTIHPGGAVTVGYGFEADPPPVKFPLELSYPLW